MSAGHSWDQGSGPVSEGPRLWSATERHGAPVQRFGALNMTKHNPLSLDRDPDISELSLFSIAPCIVGVWHGPLGSAMVVTEYDGVGVLRARPLSVTALEVTTSEPGSAVFRLAQHRGVIGEPLSAGLDALTMVWPIVADVVDCRSPRWDLTDWHDVDEENGGWFRLTKLSADVQEFLLGPAHYSVARTSAV